MATFKQAYLPKLIYVYRINNSEHEGVLKIGEASCHSSEYFSLKPNSKELNEAAKERIRHQTQTVGVSFELLYTESTSTFDGKEIKSFQDHEVHNILRRSGIKQKFFEVDKDGHKANEWFYTDLETVKKAIAAAKEGRSSLNAGEISKGQSPVIFRPEQQDAITRTIKQFTKKNSSNQMLWNAKMRFGKTLTALQVIKEMNFNRTLILTHRPVVDKGWFDDYRKIFYDRNDFEYCSKKNGGSLSEEKSFYEKLKTASKNGMSDFHFIYFASIQDMRGSEVVGGKFEKNEEIFNIDWDFIIIDEAHEGTQTELGKNVISLCRKKDTKVLHLSGTPFNLMNDFKEEEIYTWDYVMEQKAKADWELLHQGDPNPYACLPRLNIFTYNLGSLYPDYADADIAFNFREFFRVDEDGSFVHESNVKQFLDLLTKEDKDSNYPFSTKEYRENFRHSLWMIPGVKEARALSKLLQKHPVFSQFEIVNVAGDGDEEVDSSDALKAVENAMGSHPEETYTITLSCGRLTTGVSVKPWTACFMLCGTYSTAASTYMQTIFRVQTPAIIGGKQKEECFVFDFAPDRTLKVIAETAKISHKAGTTTQNDREILGDFLNFCPIIGFEGSKMVQYDTPKMLEQLKKVYVERVVKNGFEDGYLYSNDLLKLSEVELKAFEDLKKIIGTTKAMAKTGEIDINSLGFTEEEFEQLNSTKKQKEKRELTPEEEALKAKMAEARKNRDAAVSILRGISIRMPLLIYGAELNKNLDGSDNEAELTIDNFTSLIDDISWKEFMPEGVTKEKFNLFKKYYDPDVFHAAGKRIREMAKAADNLSIEERIERISTIFNSFRNPDKETVLTPWRVVNMHLTDCLGGWRFYDEKYEAPVTEPVYVEQKDVTKNVYKKNTKILEINSKSGLYALYEAYAVYKAREKLELGPKPTREMQKDLWNKVLAENIFVLCKTPMAKSISRRTLAGFTGAKVNAHYFEDLVNQLKNKGEQFTKKVTGPNFWNRQGSENMTFDAIVGNPPYQVMDGGAQASASPIYNEFVNVAEKIEPNYVSMIMPSRWYAGGKGLDEFRDKMLNDVHLSVLHDFLNPESVFPNTNIRGGLCYFLWNKNYDNTKDLTRVVTHSDKEIISDINRSLKTEGTEIFIRSGEATSIIEKVFKSKPESFENYVSSRKPFGLDTTFAKGDDFKSSKEGMKNPVNCYGKGWKIGYVERNQIKQHSEWIDEYKVFTSRANNIGTELNDDNLVTVIGKPNTVCTESYLILGINLNLTEISAENLSKYCKTKFARFMHSLAKASQDATSKTYKFVPLQNFTAQSDIDWSATIPQIDRQLYAKYSLSQEEAAFIEKMIKPME